MRKLLEKLNKIKRLKKLIKKRKQLLRLIHNNYKRISLQNQLQQQLNLNHPTIELSMKHLPRLLSLPRKK